MLKQTIPKGVKTAEFSSCWLLMLLALEFQWSLAVACLRQLAAKNVALILVAQVNQVRQWLQGPKRYSSRASGTRPDARCSIVELKKSCCWLCVVDHTFNPSAQVTEAGGVWVLRQPGLCQEDHVFETNKKVQLWVVGDQGTFWIFTLCNGDTGF